MNEDDSKIRQFEILLIVAAERIVTKIVHLLSKRDPADRFLTNTFLLHILVITFILLICFFFDRLR